MATYQQKIITLVIGGRANWGRARTFAIAAKKSEQVRLDLVLMGSALNDEFGSTEADVCADGFDGQYWKIPTRTVDDNHADQARATAEAILGLCDYIEECKPDCMVTIADRFETIATAISSSFSNILLAHIQGGEISGNIDEKVRWAISMLSDIHLPSSDIAETRLLANPQIKGTVFLSGCPAMDTMLSLTGENMNQAKLVSGVQDDFVLVSLHPNTENINESIEIYYELEKLIHANPNIHFYILKPNTDAGNLALRKVLTSLEPLKNTIVTSGIGPVDYAALIKQAKLLIGNSSSLIREGSAVGTAAILLGDRQRGRDLEHNVLKCTDISELQNLFSVVYGKNFRPTNRYGNGQAGEKILQAILGQLSH